MEEITYKKDRKTKEFSRIDWTVFENGITRPPTGNRARGGKGHGMLRNKVGVKKMMTDNGLCVFISPVQCNALAAR